MILRKYPKKTNIDRYAGIERAVACLEECCIIDEGKKDTIKNNKKLLRGFNNPEDIPEKNREAAEWFIDFLDGYDIQLANVDLETDMMNSLLRNSLKEFYDEDNEMSDEEIIDEMKKHKALNMYHFLQKKKEQLHLLKDDRLANLLISAKEYIESHYGTYTHPA